MTQGPMSPGERNERRNTRIRQLREQREAPIRRRKSFQPVVLVAWLAGVAVLAAIVIFLGFLAFAPRLLAWVEDNPGWIEQGAVRDFVQWYKPDELKDAPASANRQRITVEVQPGITDSQIGDGIHVALPAAARESGAGEGETGLRLSDRDADTAAAVVEREDAAHSRVTGSMITSMRHGSVGTEVTHPGHRLRSTRP